MLNTKNVSSKELGTAVVLSRLNIYRELSSMQYQTNAGLELTNSVTGDKISFTDSTKEKNALISLEKRISGSDWFLNGFLVYTNQNSSIFYIIVMFLSMRSFPGSLIKSAFSKLLLCCFARFLFRKTAKIIL